MTGAATIVIVQDDLSIAGAEPDPAGPNNATDNEKRLLTLIHGRHPDVIVVDCRGERRNGVSAIGKIRGKTDIPILAICDAADPSQRQYRLSGATDCLVPPFDIVAFNTTVQDIMRLGKRRKTKAVQPPQTFQFSGVVFQPRQNMVTANGSSAKLTTAENHLLSHFMQRPWTICSRVEIAEVLYGPYKPISDRAIDVIVARLRKKLNVIRGSPGSNLVKTEFRLGYMFVSEVSVAHAGD